MATTAIKAAAHVLLNVSDTHAHLSDDLRKAMKVTANASLAQSESEQVNALKNLLHHA
ncbi:MAG: hypothetical protein HAW67_03635 [Endozoicomonadaceae bacterium]|nr:hypothetical protein [Endozoicomonadaceae bacterium]